MLRCPQIASKRGGVRTETGSKSVARAGLDFRDVRKTAGFQRLLSATLTVFQIASPVPVDTPPLSTVDLSGRSLSAIPKMLRIQ
jgi:hypothetical protein